MEEIKIGFCVAYDWYLLKNTLPPIYKAADLICLSVDRNRVSWSGKQFVFDEAGFRSFISELDVDGKIKIHEDKFYVASQTPMQNEVRQRNMIAVFMKEGGWHIQLDCDEYFSEFDAFVGYLKGLRHRSYRFNVCCSLRTLFKRVNGGYLIVLPGSVKQVEFIQVATRTPHYEYGRRNGEFNIFAHFSLLHQSWARDASEIQQKIESWGHTNDFDVLEFVRFWNGLDEANYESIRNFHPIQPDQWSSLALAPADSMGDISRLIDEKGYPAHSKFQLLVMNWRFRARVVGLWRKLLQ